MVDKQTQKYILIGAVVLAVVMVMRHHGANTPAVHEDINNDVGWGNTPFLRTGYTKHYPLLHDYWWCQAQNEDVGLSMTRWGRSY